MLIYGHRFIKSQNFYHVQSIEAIKNTPASSILLVDFTENNLDIITHITLNSISLALEVKNITEIIYANSLSSSYILVHKNLAKSAQDLAQNYLFDAKILVIIENEEEIEELAILGLDGVILSNAVIKVNS